MNRLLHSNLHWLGQQFSQLCRCVAFFFQWQLLTWRWTFLPVAMVNRSIGAPLMMAFYSCHARLNSEWTYSELIELTMIRGLFPKAGSTNSESNPELWADEPWDGKLRVFGSRTAQGEQTQFSQNSLSGTDPSCSVTVFGALLCETSLCFMKCPVLWHVVVFWPSGPP